MYSDNLLVDGLIFKLRIKRLKQINPHWFSVNVLVLIIDSVVNYPPILCCLRSLCQTNPEPAPNTNSRMGIYFFQRGHELDQPHCNA